MAVIPALRRLKKEDQKFKFIFNYIASSGQLRVCEALSQITKINKLRK